MTTDDYVKIIGNLKHDFDKEFRCKYPEKWEQFKDPDKQKEMYSLMNYCDGKVSANRPSYAHAYKKIDFLTCPCTFHDPEFINLYDMEYGFNKHGISYIYINRTIDKCPAKLVAAFKLIRSYRNEKDKEERERAEQEAINKSQIKK